MRPQPELARQATAAASQLNDAFGSSVDLVGIFARYAQRIFSRRDTAPSVERVGFRLSEAIEETVAEIRGHYEEAERQRCYAEAERQTKHRALMQRLKGRIARRAAKLTARVAEERSATPPGEYAVVVRGSDIMVRLIYGLVDPAEPSRIRYVGQTIRGAHNRYMSHVGRYDQTPRGQWVASLIEAGRYPDMVLIEQVAAHADISAIEMHWIGEMWKRGEADLNVSGPARVRSEVTQ